ncbi:hypothetical protein [Candidatus Enterococcus clewellii]|uniref:Uncharacterized protein n=1 Tax=Candidatus Enterococcus clewellii TaxID=1834193 RepID=A0AAQ3XZG0_9ENTE
MRKIIFGIVLFIVGYIVYTVNPTFFNLFKNVKALIKLSLIAAIILLAFRKKMTPDDGE